MSEVKIRKEEMFSLEDLPFDSMGEIISYLDEFVDLLCVCLAMPGLYEYLKQMNYNSCRNITFRVRKQFFQSLFLIKKTPIVLKVSHVFPLLLKQRSFGYAERSANERFEHFTRSFRSSFPNLKKMEFSFVGILQSANDPKPFMLENFSNLHTIIMNSPPPILEFRNLPKFTKIELNGKTQSRQSRARGHVNVVKELPKFIIDHNRLNSVKIRSFIMRKSDYELLITEETKEISFQSVFFEFEKIRKEKSETKPKKSTKPIKYEKPKKFITFPSQLQKLELCDCNHSNEFNKYKFDLLSKKFNELQYLRIRNVNFSHNLLQLSFDSIPNLQFLDGDTSSLSRISSEDLMISIYTLSKLRNLKLVDNSDWKSKQIFSTHEISFLPNLQTLSIKASSGRGRNKNIDNLRKVNFMEIVDLFDSDKVGNNFPSLTSLKVHTWRHVLNDIFDREKVISRHISHQLVRLDLYIHKTLEHEHIVFEEKTFPNLKSFIHGRRNKNIKKTNTSMFLDIEIHLPKLRYLEVRYCKYLNLVHAPNLRTLSIDGSDRCKDFVQIRFADENSTNVRVLELFSSSKDVMRRFRFRSKNWFAHEFDFLGVFGCLEELYLKNCEIEQLKNFDGDFFPQLMFFKFENVPFGCLKNVDESKRLR